MLQLDQKVLRSGYVFGYGTHKLLYLLGEDFAGWVNKCKSKIITEMPENECWLLRFSKNTRMRLNPALTKT